jgi:hypothetical protein
VIDLAEPADPDPSSRMTGPPAARVRPGLPGDDANDAGRRHLRTGRWIGLSGQIAASLLPEVGDSRAVDGGVGR